MSFRAKLGQTVRDKLTGIEGTVVARSEYLYGCVRLSLQPAEVKDGKPADWVNLDEPQCEAVPKSKASKRPAGARPAGPKPTDPGRPVDRGH